MTRPSCASPVALATLLEYWLGELDEAREAALDEHLLGCGHCSASLQSLVDLAGEVRAAVRAGAVHTVVADAFVKRLAAQGLRLREYRVPHNGSVYCTVAPDDDLLITRLDAPLGGVERLDVERVGGEGAVLERLRDVPFDAAAGEVVIAERMEVMRALPASTARMRLLAMAPSGERLVGEYTFHHTPHRPGDSR
jgi:Putative zinc-finger